MTANILNEGLDAVFRPTVSGPTVVDVFQSTLLNIYNVLESGHNVVNQSVCDVVHIGVHWLVGSIHIITQVEP